MRVEIRIAEGHDYAYLAPRDEHLRPEKLKEKIDRGEVMVVVVDGQPQGWLRYGYLWDVVPFMNLLFVEEDHRRRGCGTALIQFWDGEMRARGHDLVMTSSQADEQAQHLYRRLGYRDCGSMLFPGQVAVEILFLKTLAPD